ncbi:MAG: Stk1 family PASTA domain-containing Ser/Thr kinase [Saccharofermentans sp.]|nr:Stk1 family PASTA domain-containing Ser/Thr kinase [Saccharofermentans sp.]
MNNVQGPEGMTFAGKYRIVRLIGRGGMANVYLATDISSGVNVAIKILKPEYSSDEEFIRRFDTEAKAVSMLNHSNIVKVFGVGHEGNYRYIVQEYVEGITVKELINQNGHLDWKVAVPIVIQVGMALENAHQNGIVHRDIKPQNILISRDRIAKITDFGIARASTNSTITMTSGGAMGSVHYFSPEQARGGNVGPASDIYSVGVMLFEMVTGRVPFDGDSNVAIAVKHLQEAVPKASSFVPGIPAGLDAIINKCMQKTPDKRYKTMSEMVTELDAILVDPNGVYGVISNTGNSDNEVNISFRQDPNYDKIGEMEKSAEVRRMSRLRDNVLLILIIVAIVGVLVGLSVLVITSIKNATNIEQNTDYEVKNYVGSLLSEVKDELDRNNINYEIQYENTEEYEPGTIIAQNIAEGMIISEKSAVSKLILTVAAPLEATELADYAGMPFSDAYRMLSNLGYVVSLRSMPSDEFDEDTVIRTEPEAGSTVNVGDAVCIVYATAPTSSLIPDLRGDSLETARTKLSELNLVIGQIDGSPEVLALPESQQFVMTTTPAAGTSVPRRSSIKIIVGSADDVANGGTPTPTPVMYTVTVTMEGGGTAQGGGTYAPGTLVTLQAEAATDYHFVCWRDGLNNIVGYNADFSFVVGNANVTYKAVFERSDTPTPTPTNTPTPTPTTAPADPTTPDPPPVGPDGEPIVN